MGWRQIIVILGIATASFCGEAYAADELAAGSREGWHERVASDFPDPMPSDVWWTVGWNKRLTTSQCIGKDTSPLCVIETEMACWARLDVELCRKARKNPSYTPDDFERIPRTGLMMYNVWSVEKLSAKAIAQLTKIGTFTNPGFYQPGDLIISIRWSMCGRAQNGRFSDCCAKYDDNGAFVVRKIEAEWIVVAWNLVFRNWQGYEREPVNKKVAVYPPQPFPIVECAKKGVTMFNGY